MPGVATAAKISFNGLMVLGSSVLEKPSKFLLAEKGFAGVLMLLLNAGNITQAQTVGIESQETLPTALFLLLMMFGESTLDLTRSTTGMDSLGLKSKALVSKFLSARTERFGVSTDNKKSFVEMGSAVLGNELMEGSPTSPSLTKTPLLATIQTMKSSSGKANGSSALEKQRLSLLERRNTSPFGE